MKKAFLNGGILGNCYDKILYTLINEINLNEHIKTYEGEHDEWYAEPEFTGKYLDLCMRIYNEHKEEKALYNAEKIVESILENMREDGYIAGLKKGEEFINFGVWNQTFTIMGLISYYKTTLDFSALNACEKCTDFIMNNFIKGKNNILNAINGGIQNITVLFILSDLYELTKNNKYLEYINFITDVLKNTEMNFLNFESIFDIQSKKGIESLIVLIAILKAACITNETDYIRSVEKYWQEVYDTQIRNTGNGTIGENWTKGGNAAMHLSAQQHPNETCVAVGWIELSLSLFYQTKDVKYINAIDRTLYNHILASVSENGDDFAYFQPNYGKQIKNTTVGQYKCCRYRGFTLFTYMSDMLFFEDDSDIIPLIYTNAKYTSDNINIEETTNYPFEKTITFNIQTGNKFSKNIKIRIPENCEIQKIEINSKETEFSKKDSYIIISLSKNSDYEITVFFNPLLREITGKINGKNVVSYEYGCVLLALIDAENKKHFKKGLNLTKTTLKNSYLSFITQNDEATRFILTDYASADNYRVWIDI